MSARLHRATKEACEDALVALRRAIGMMPDDTYAIVHDFLLRALHSMPFQSTVDRDRARSRARAGRHPTITPPTEGPTDGAPHVD
jgi:hypothetical protein